MLDTKYKSKGFENPGNGTNQGECAAIKMTVENEDHFGALICARNEIDIREIDTLGRPERRGTDICRLKGLLGQYKIKRISRMSSKTYERSSATSKGRYTNTGDEKQSRCNI